MTKNYATVNGKRCLVKHKTLAFARIELTKLTSSLVSLQSLEVGYLEDIFS